VHIANAVIVDHDQTGENNTDYLAIVRRFADANSFPAVSIDNNCSNYDEKWKSFVSEESF